MHRFIVILRQNRLFFILWAVFFSTATILSLVIPKDVLHLAVNSFHSNWLDVVFPYITWLGDLFVLPVFFVLLFIRYRYGFMLLTGYVLATLMVQIPKHYLFPDVVRPARYFEGKADLHFVEGIELHNYNSFPSGHSATAFMLFSLLALIVSNQQLKLLFFVAAFLAAFSRVYLSQHFVADIAAGSLIGTWSAVAAYWTFGRMEGEWLQKSLRKKW